MKGPGLLRRLLGRRRHEPPGPMAIRRPGRVGARPRGHSGVHSPRLQNADGAAFLVDGRSSGTSAQATRTARERRRIRRPADHHCRGLARGVRARTGRRSRGCPASHARLLPQHRYHVARTGGAGDGGTRPNAVVQVIWCVHRRSRATSGVGRRNRSKFAPELGRRFWRRGRSRPGDAARHQPGGDDELQRQVVCLVCRRRCLSRDLAPGRDGVDGDARWPTRAYRQGSLRIYRRHHVCPPFAAARSNISPITSGPASHGSSSCGKTLRTTTYPSREQLGLNGSFAVFKKVETDVVGFEDFLQSNKDKIDPELLAAKMCGRWRNGVPLALSPDTDSPAGGISPEQLNDFGYVDADGSGDPKGIRCPVGAHIRRVNPRGQPVAGQGVPGGSNNSHRLIRRGLPYGPTYDPSETLRWHRARDALSVHQLEHRKPIRVRAATVGSMTASSPGPSGFTQSRKIH